MKIKRNKIEWEWDDFQGHPDLKAVSAFRLGRLADRLPKKCGRRFGQGYVLPDGEWAFPGEQAITVVCSFNSWENWKKYCSENCPYGLYKEGEE